MNDMNRESGVNHHMPQQLREVSTLRCVGLRDAIMQLGKHEVCGTMVYYTRQQVYLVLTGKHQSKKMLDLIGLRSPALFKLRYTTPEIKAWYKEHEGEFAARRIAEGIRVL